MLNLNNELIKTLSHKKSPSRKGILQYAEKETVKTVSKGGYI